MPTNGARITISMSEYSGLLAGCKTALQSLIANKLDGPLDFKYTCDLLKEVLIRVEGKEATEELIKQAECEAITLEATATTAKMIYEMNLEGCGVDAPR